MGIETVNNIKGYFQTGDKPSQANFYSMLESNFVCLTTSIQTLGVNDTIDPSVGSLIPVVGSGGAITLASNPSIVAGVDGQVIVIMGTNDTTTLTLTNGNGMTLVDNITLGNKASITMVYSTTYGWCEVCRGTDTAYIAKISKKWGIVFG